MMILIVPLVVFLGVAALVVAVSVMFTKEADEVVENRLQAMTSGVTARGGGQAEIKVYQGSLNEKTDWIEEAITRHFNLPKFIEQSGVNITTSQLVMITLGLVGGVTAIAYVLRLPMMYCPLVGLPFSVLPLAYVWFMRGRRLTAFGRQLPEALELISRALRAGHSLASGISLVAEELPEPIRSEFERVYEAQNLGRPLESSMEEMAERVPNLDLRFFVTAVLLQRQTGGDLAEILDKIGYLIRERFKLFGQIQALTGEGRMSGAVLLALPPVLFVVLWRLNPTYITPLFTDPMGQQMLAGGIFMQFLGAIVIKKIIDIKV
jgi:tight adherence protein B